MARSMCQTGGTAAMEQFAPRRILGRARATPAGGALLFRRIMPVTRPGWCRFVVVRSFSNNAREDPYSVLGVHPGASRERIRAAYLAVSKRTHPDLNPGDSSAKLRFQRVQQAYQVLKGLPASGDALHDLRADRFAPRAGSRAAPPDARHFNEELWRAWHFGENATATEAVRQADEARTRHQSFFAKRSEASASGANGRTSHRQMKKDRDGIASRLYERQRARRATDRAARSQDGRCAIS